MNLSKEKVVALFDFDGVIMDTESQYTVFWNKMGREYLQIENFGPGIKGQTMTQIYERYFKDKQEEQKVISGLLYQYEREMTYHYIPGVVDFIEDLKRQGVRVAIVTSSDERKMETIYAFHPELRELTERVLTGEMFTRSKPAPDCFLLGMRLLAGTPECTYVFEDSFHGLQAGMDSGATVVGLATTNSRDSIADKAHFVIDNFSGMTFDKLVAMRR